MEFEIVQTAEFAGWLRRLGDQRARAAVLTRIRRLSLGNAGDARPVGEGVSELRVDIGPGYRIYVIRNGARTVLLLGGGTKSTQQRDIGRAIELARMGRS